MINKLHILFFIICFSLSSEFSFAQTEIRDPWEGFNRKTQDLNDFLDGNVFEPVARGYDYVVPDKVIIGIDNFFYNLEYPSRLLSDVLQLKFSQAASHTGRFLINSTVGVLGLVDVAQGWGLEKHSEDIGTALAYWGVPAGPYVVLPFFGPSNVRDTFGLVADTVLSPIFWVSYTNAFSGSDQLIFSLGTGTFKYLNKRARLLDTIDSAKESAIDYYLFVQSAYYQYRDGIIFDGNTPGQGDDWLDEDDIGSYELGIESAN